MKKTILRSFVVGLFAVVSLNASAEMNYNYMNYYFGGSRQGALGEYSVYREWLEPDSYAVYELDAFPYSTTDHTGQLVRVVWGPDFSHAGIYDGDIIGVSGINDTGACISYQGTNAVYEILVEVNSEGHFLLGIRAGSTAGYRSFGPIFYWAQCWEDTFFGGPGVVNWSVVWGYSAW